MWIKICGITTEDELESAVQLGPDALGFVVATEQSVRNLSAKRAEDLIGLVPPSVSTVIVTLNPERVTKIASSADYVQIYENYPFPPSNVIRGYLVDEWNSAFTSQGVMTLIDTRHGSGKTHDWSITRKINETINVPLILAGGLTPKNVAAAIEEVRPFGVDVSTGVERRGRKSYQLMKKFIERARGVTGEKLQIPR
jgi:phosphoribosylanthranilate isomerase